MRQKLPIALLSSTGADELVQRFGFSHFADLFSPLAQLSVNVKEPFNASTISSEVSLDFRDLQKQGYLLSLTVLPPTLHEGLSECRHLEDCVTQFYTLFSHWAEPVEQETFKSYISCVFVVAGCEQQPLSELSRLIQLQHTQQHGSSDGQILAPSHCAPPKWRTPTTLKHYVLVHDSKRDDWKRSEETFTQMCSTYGVECCQMLKIGDGEGTGLPDLWSFVSQYERILERGLIRARNALIAKTTETSNANNANSSISTISFSTPSPLSTLPIGTPSGSNSSPLESPEENKRNVSSKDREAIKSFLENFSTKCLIPHCERVMRSLSEQIGQRRGIPKSLTAGMKKWFGGSTPTQTAPISYSNESSEMQSRRLADLLFELGLFSLSHQQYQSVKKEFQGDNALAHYAIALEMSAYSLYLSNSSLTAKQFPTHYFENALNQLLTANTVRWTSSIRCVLHCAEVFSSVGMNVEAAMQLVRLTSVESDLNVAVCLSRAAIAFDSATMQRKAAFYRVLAGHRFVKAELSHLARESYRTALQQYFEKNWNSAEDHIAFLVSKDSSDRKVAMSCATRLLRSGTHQTEEQLNGYLQHYVDTIKRFNIDSTEPVEMQIPLVDLSSIRVICGERPVEAESREGEHEWTDMQRAAFHALAGPSSAFRPLQLLSNNETDNSKKRETPSGERFRVQMNVTNPLSIPLTLRNIQLQVNDVDLVDETNGSGSGKSIWEEMARIDTITIQSAHTIQIELWLRPSPLISRFHITHLLFQLVSSNGLSVANGMIALNVRGKKLQAKSLSSNLSSNKGRDVSYGPDHRLEAIVSPNIWPLLDVQLEKPLAERMFCGQAIRIFLRVSNIGQEDISGICLSTDYVDGVCGGWVDTEGKRVTVQSHLSSNNQNVRAIALKEFTIARGDTQRLFIDIRCPQSSSPLPLALIVFYRGVGGACREWRLSFEMKPQNLFNVASRLLDPSHGLFSLDFHNSMRSSDAEVARVEILKIRTHSALLNQSGLLVNGPSISLKPLRLRSVELDCSQSDSVCLSVGGASESTVTPDADTLWMGTTISDTPSWPLPSMSSDECSSDESRRMINRPILHITVLWKGSLVNKEGQVSSFLGESIVSDPFLSSSEQIPGVEWPMVEGENNGRKSSNVPVGVSISCSQISPVTHDFGNHRLCEFPIYLSVRNEDTKKRTCSVTVRFTPKISLPLTPPLPSDARQQWWVDREVIGVNGISVHSEEKIRVRIRVAQPSVYDLLGTQVQATVLFDNGEEVPIVVPSVHALVISS